MTPLPAALGGDGALIAWRLDMAQFATSWDSGEGARAYGGRWNSKGRRVVYCSLDPACAILEVAVHKGFKALDIVPHVLTQMLVTAPPMVFVVKPGAVPNAQWLHPGTPSAGQQRFGDQLLETHPMLVVPSTVYSYSWNLLFDPAQSRDRYVARGQQAFALDPRLHPPIA